MHIASVCEEVIRGSLFIRVGQFRIGMGKIHIKLPYQTNSLIYLFYKLQILILSGQTIFCFKHTFVKDSECKCNFTLWFFSYFADLKAVTLEPNCSNTIFWPTLLWPWPMTSNIQTTIDEFLKHFSSTSLPVWQQPHFP